MQKNLLKNILLRAIPFPESVRNFKRKICPCSLSFNNVLLEKGIEQLQMLSNIGFSIEGRTILEIGTGWQPIIPIIFYLKGCKNIVLTDIHRYLDNNLFLETINGFF